MTCEGISPGTMIDESPELPQGPWMDGRRLTFDVPEPLRYTLDANYPGQPMAMYEVAAPLMRDDLAEALLAAGVDNLQRYRAVLFDPNTKMEHTDYQAINVVGAVACADMDESELMGTSDSTMIDVDFDALVIDEAKAGDALIFRLAEAVSAIVVHEKLKSEIEAREIPGMTFYGPGEWSG